MKKMGIKILLGLLALGVVIVGGYQLLERQYQKDADAWRVEDLYTIANLIEEYHDITDYYPLLDQSTRGIYLNVLIASDEQAEGLQGAPNTKMMSEEALEAELSSVLGYEVVLPHDPQRVSTNGRPNIYEYNLLNGEYYLKTYLYNPMQYSFEKGPHFHTFEVTSYPGCQPCDTVWTYSLLEK